MLTLKMIAEQTDKVIAGLEKKHFNNAKETIAQVLELNNKRRSTQGLLDNNLAEVNRISKSIGGLMKEGKKEEAEAAKKQVSEIKEKNKVLQAEMDQAAEDLQNLLYTIRPIPGVLEAFYERQFQRVEEDAARQRAAELLAKSAPQGRQNALCAPFREEASPSPDQGFEGEFEPLSEEFARTKGKAG